MDEIQQRVEEYKSLREEIIAHQRVIWQICTFMLTGAAAIFGYGLESESSTVILAPLIVLVPGIQVIIWEWGQMYRIGAYIRLVIETKVDGLNWETHWAKLRESKINIEKRPLTAYSRSRTHRGKGLLWRYSEITCLLLTFHSLEVLCVTIASLKMLTPFKWQASTFALFGLYLFLVVHITYSIFCARLSEDSAYHGEFWERYLKGVIGSAGEGSTEP